ncbi:MAG: tetratricopeptide repeat protein [Bacteroidota bacterium]|nr:tetratricopeptide repeat protein [Bacteroidota bacterium]
MQDDRLIKLLDMLKLQPDDAFLNYAVALEYESIKDKNNSEKYFKKLLKEHSAYLPTYYKAAYFFLDKQEYRTALTIIESGLKLARTTHDIKTIKEMQELRNIIEEEMEDHS